MVIWGPYGILITPPCVIVFFEFLISCYPPKHITSPGFEAGPIVHSTEIRWRFCVRLKYHICWHGTIGVVSRVTLPPMNIEPDRDPAPLQVVHTRMPQHVERFHVKRLGHGHVVLNHLNQGWCFMPTCAPWVLLGSRFPGGIWRFLLLLDG